MRYLFEKKTIHLSILVYLVVLFITPFITWAQHPTGTIVVDLIHSKNLENDFGEETERGTPIRN